MQTTNLIIKKCWLDKILSGEKKIEYREIKPYYYRLEKLNTPFVCVLQNGYSKNCLKVEIIINKIIKNIKTNNYELHIHKIKTKE